MKTNPIKPKILVLAGNREQFERYLGENGLTDSEALYAYSTEVMAGIRDTFKSREGSKYITLTP